MSLFGLLSLRLSFLYSVQFSLVAQPCLPLGQLMDCSMPGFPVHHHLPELAQPHVHWARDAMQPSHPLLPLLLLPAIFPSIFSSVSALHIRWPSIRASALASVLPANVQGWLPWRLTSLPFPSLGDLPIPGIKSASFTSPALAVGLFTKPSRAYWIQVILWIIDVKNYPRISLVVQCLRFHASIPGDQGLILGQETKIPWHKTKNE